MNVFGLFTYALNGAVMQNAVRFELSWIFTFVWSPNPIGGNPRNLDSNHLTASSGAFSEISIYTIQKCIVISNSQRDGEYQPGNSITTSHCVGILLSHNLCGVIRCPAYGTFRRNFCDTAFKKRNTINNINLYCILYEFYYTIAIFCIVML